MSNISERCSDCEVFKNHEKDKSLFALGFFCPLMDKFVSRDDLACDWRLSDGLPF